MNRKKGFTLIELLAVIILLAIIAVITTPLILNKIEDVRFAAFKSSVDGVVRSLKNQHAIEDYGRVTYNFPLQEGIKIDVKGDLSTWEGQSFIDKNGMIALSIKSGNYCAYKTISDDKITYDQNCEKLKDQKPLYVLQSWNMNSTTDFHNPTYRDKIQTIEFVTNNEVPTDAIESWDVSDTQDETIMAWVKEEGEFYHLYIGGENGVYANPNSAYLFNHFTALETIDFEYYDTSKVTNMKSMFSGCNHLTTLDLSHFDTRNVTDMSDMFNDTTNLSVLNLSSFDTSKVINMANMFFGASNLEDLVLNNFHTENLTDMSRMFFDCKKIKNVDLSHFNTSKVINMDGMFSSCSGLEELNFKVQNENATTNSIFSGTPKLHKITVDTLVNLDLNMNHQDCTSNMAFIGWFDNQNGTGSSITSIPAGSNGTYYAIFSTDIEAPIITVSGHTSDFTITQGPREQFVVPEGTAIDNIDGVVEVTSSGNVIPSIKGTYAITYTAKDSSGNVGTLVLTVVIVDPTYSDYMTGPELVEAGHTANEFGVQSKTQYGYQDVTGWNNTWSTTKPSDGYYKTKTQYNLSWSKTTNTNKTGSLLPISNTALTNTGTNSKESGTLSTGVFGPTITANVKFEACCNEGPYDYTTITILAQRTTGVWDSQSCRNDADLAKNGSRTDSCTKTFSSAYQYNKIKIEYSGGNRSYLNSASITQWIETTTQTGTTGWQDSNTTSLGTVTNTQTRTVYATPSSWSASTGWRDEVAYNKTTTRKPITRTLYRYQTN